MKEEGSKEEDSPRWRQVGAKMAWPQDSPKMAPRCAQTAPGRPKMTPRWPQDDPSWSQHGPIMALKAPKTKLSDTRE